MTKDANNLYNKNIESLKNSILVLDMGINGMNVINSLKKDLPYEKIIYMNDLMINNYEDLEINDCEKRVDILFNRVKELSPKLIVVSNDTLIEYGKDKLNELNIPYVSLVDEIIECVTKNYDSKDMAFFATLGIIEANIYQKNFVYSRLYNLNLDNIMNSMNNCMMKTSTSFKEMKNAFLPLYKKDVDVIIPTLPNVMLFKTEMMEFIDNQNINIIDVSSLLSQKALYMIKKYNRMNNIEVSDKQKEEKFVYVISNFDEKSESNKLYSKLLNVKYKLVKDDRIDPWANYHYTLKKDIIE